MSADLKPRGVKDPMHLIPWSAVPASHVPLALLEAAQTLGEWPDGDPVRTVTLAGDSIPGLIFRHLIRNRATTLGEVARVFDHGAKKYARDNWRTFAWTSGAEDEYFAAIMRHLTATHNGQEFDPDSGLRHTAHAACGCLIWIWHLNRATVTP